MEHRCTGDYWGAHQVNPKSISTYMKLLQNKKSCHPVLSLRASLLKSSSRKFYVLFCWIWCVRLFKWSFFGESRLIWPSTLIKNTFSSYFGIFLDDRKVELTLQTIKTKIKITRAHHFQIFRRLETRIFFIWPKIPRIGKHLVVFQRKWKYI